jgi:serine/threonine-protein phosphatase PPG1
VDLDECISRLYKKELLAESVIEAICAKTKELLMRESNVVHVRAPVTVVGDIHGQFYDLIEIFKIGGWCPDTNYLFLGASFLRSISCQSQFSADRHRQNNQATMSTGACLASKQFLFLSV